MLNVVMLNVIMLSVDMLNVVAPRVYVCVAVKLQKITVAKASTFDQMDHQI
jgi:hypothetical protein